MAKRSIIDIDVNDEKFKEFLKIFHEYRESLEEMPEAWKKLGEAMGGTGSSFNKSATATMKVLQESAMNIAGMADSLHKAVKAQEQFYHATTVSNSGMNRLVRSSSTLGKTLFSIGKELFKLASIGAIGGAVGMFGLGDSAYRRQREARGLGLSTGQISAFKTYMAPYVEPGDLLNRAANARNDITKWWALSAMGIPIGKAQHENAEQLSFDLINQARKIWKQGPQTLQYAEARGLTAMGFSLDDLRRLANTPGSQLRSAEANAMRSAGAMGFSSKVGDEYTRMIVTLRKAGVVIESVLIKGLAPLAKPLSDMAIAFSKDFAAWVGSSDAKKTIANFGEEMREFFHFLESKRLHDDLRDLAKAIEIVTHGVIWTTKNIGEPAAKIGDSYFSGMRGLKDLGIFLGVSARDVVSEAGKGKDFSWRRLLEREKYNWDWLWKSTGPKTPVMNQATQGRVSSPQHVHIKVTTPPGYGVERQANASGH